jgi:ribosome recycling factor
MDSEKLLAETKERMNKAVAHLREELSGVRTGRANPAILEQIKVDAYGNKMDLRDLASINAPEPRLLVVQVWDQSNAAAAEKAIRESGQGLNPVSEGNLIRVSIPPLTEERRKEMTKLVHDRAEGARVAIRQIRRETMEQVEKAEKSKQMSEDDKKRLEERVQKATEEENHQIETLTKAKESEILQI